MGSSHRNSGGKKRGFMTFGRRDRRLRKNIRMPLRHVERKLEGEKLLAEHRTEPQTPKFILVSQPQPKNHERVKFQQLDPTLSYLFEVETK